MKINELFEALPGTQKQGILSRMFGGDPQAKRMKASIDQGVKSWIAYATQYGKQNPTFLQDPVMYSKVFRQWASKAANLNANHPAFNDIETELATTLRGRSTKPIEVAVAKLVNLTQSMMVNPESRYTPQMKVQAVSKLIDQKYGRYIKDIATKQAIDKFIQDTMDANTAFTADELFKATDAKVSTIISGTPPGPGGGPPGPPGGGPPITRLYRNVPYKWDGSKWVGAVTGAPANPTISAALGTP
jgi:hypothetical protein